MRSRIMLPALATTALIALAVPASADVTVTAMTDLNVRAGPGPEYPVLGVIVAADRAILSGCVEGGSWCAVDYGAVEGWAYSGYLQAEASGTAVVVTDVYPELGLPVIEYEADVYAAAPSGVVVGDLVAPYDMAAPIVIDPPATVRTHIISNPVDTVYLGGEVVVGAAVPEVVEIYPVPDYDYDYAYVNGLPVILDEERRIVYVARG